MTITRENLKELLAALEVADKATFPLHQNLTAAVTPDQKIDAQIAYNRAIAKFSEAKVAYDMALREYASMNDVA